jgi:hypothetical protein
VGCKRRYIYFKIRFYLTVNADETDQCRQDRFGIGGHVQTQILQQGWHGNIDQYIVRDCAGGACNAR